MLNPKFYNLVEDDFKKIIKSERSQYFPIFDMIEEYCKEYKEKSDDMNNRVLIGGKNALALFLNKEENSEYLLFSESPYFHAVNLANRINTFVKSLNSEWIVNMTTKISYKNFEIRVNNRIMANINILTSGFDKSDIIKLINPIEINDLLIIPPEIIMLSTYHELYSPEYVEIWDDLLNEECKLFSHIKDNFQLKHEKKITKTKFRDKLEFELLNKFVKNNNKICLIGEYALSLLLENVNPVIIKLISENSFSTDLEEIINIISNFDPCADIEHRIDTINVIGDYNLKRMSIKVYKNNIMSEVMYIYNSGYYELIPFNTNINGDDFVQIASPFVILRFLLIDIWLIRRLEVGDKINKNFAKLKSDILFSYLIEMREKLGSSCVNDKYYHSKLPGSVFQKSSYIGKYVNNIISQKIKNLKKGIYMKDYYPEGHLKQFGVYKIVK